MSNENAGTLEGFRNGELQGRRIVFLGGTSGIGLATARLASRLGAEPVLVGRNPKTLESVRRELGVERAASFDVTDEADLEAFFDELGGIDHVFVTTGNPHYGLLAEMDLAAARRALDERVSTMLYVARHGGRQVRAGGSLTFMGGTGSRRPVPGLAVTGAMNAAAEALVRSLAVEIAPVRVNLIAAGFVDTLMSARVFGDEERLEVRREELRRTLPIRRVIGPEDVARAALHLMTNTAITGVILDLNGGQQLI